MQLEQLAEILRFQDRREAESEGGDGIAYSEARPSDIDPLTGFLLPEDMCGVRLFKAPKRYAIRKWDILMFFNGAPERIGTVGLVIDEVKAVPSRSLCIIRAYDVPPTALFLYLRAPEIRKEVQGLARPNKFDRKSFVNIEALRKHEIGGLFVKAMKQAEDKCRLLIDYYRDCRKGLDDRIYEIQKGILHAWPED